MPVVTPPNMLVATGNTAAPALAQVYERKVHCLSNYNAEEAHAPWSIAAGCGGVSSYYLSMHFSWSHRVADSSAYSCRGPNGFSSPGSRLASLPDQKLHPALQPLKVGMFATRYGFTQVVVVCQ